MSEHLVGEIREPPEEVAKKDWPTLYAALSDPDRRVVTTARKLNNFMEIEIAYQVEKQVRERMAELEKRYVNLPQAAEILGPSHSENWLNGNQIATARKKLLVQVTSEKTGKTSIRPMSQKELAKEVDTAQSMISDVERMGYFPVSENPKIIENLIWVLGPYGLTEDKLKSRWSR